MRDRVVERFVRLDQSRTVPGSGLGLSLVAAVTRLHGGELKFEDNAQGPKEPVCEPSSRCRAEDHRGRDDAPGRPKDKTRSPRVRWRHGSRARQTAGRHPGTTAVRGWLAALPNSVNAEFKKILALHPRRTPSFRAAAFSPYLWDLASADARRCSYSAIRSRCAADIAGDRYRRAGEYHHKRKRDDAGIAGTKARPRS